MKGVLLTKYYVNYYGYSHQGYCRGINQDNFICVDQYMDPEQEALTAPLHDRIPVRDQILLGVFDGMGGEECGEKASLIAARCAAKYSFSGNEVQDLLGICTKANQEICRFMDENMISSMGTTAAMIGFSRKGVTICNVGDSKIFRYSQGTLKQISYDHVSIAPFGMKPPLSQNLGIRPEEMIIDPYVAQGDYHGGDIYLICSDGLTDMVDQEEITEIIKNTEWDEMMGMLMRRALEHGGRDNISIILCRIEANSIFGFLSRR